MRVASEMERKLGESSLLPMGGQQPSGRQCSAQSSSWSLWFGAQQAHAKARPLATGGGGRQLPAPSYQAGQCANCASIVKWLLYSACILLIIPSEQLNSGAAHASPASKTAIKQQHKLSDAREGPPKGSTLTGSTNGPSRQRPLHLGKHRAGATANQGGKQQEEDPFDGFEYVLEGPNGGNSDASLPPAKRTEVDIGNSTAMERRPSAPASAPLSSISSQSASGESRASGDNSNVAQRTKRQMDTLRAAPAAAMSSCAPDNCLSAELPPRAVAPSLAPTAAAHLGEWQPAPAELAPAPDNWSGYGRQQLQRRRAATKTERQQQWPAESKPPTGNPWPRNIIDYSEPGQHSLVRPAPQRPRPRARAFEYAPAQQLLYDAPNVVEPPHSDAYCPMRGPLTVCDQIAAYPADVILERLQSAQNQLGKSYFNIQSFFSDERDHLSEPFGAELAEGLAAARGQRARTKDARTQPPLAHRASQTSAGWQANNQSLPYGRQSHALGANYVPINGNQLIAVRGRSGAAGGRAAEQTSAAGGGDEFLQLVERNGIPAAVERRQQQGHAQPQLLLAGEQWAGSSGRRRKRQAGDRSGQRTAGGGEAAATAPRDKQAAALQRFARQAAAAGETSSAEAETAENGAQDGQPSGTGQVSAPGEQPVCRAKSIYISPRAAVS